MIPLEQLEKQAARIKDSIKYAKVYMGDTVTEGAILKITQESNVVKVFISLTDAIGTVTKVEIYDMDDDLLQVQDMDIVKDRHQGFMAVVEIAVRNEVGIWR